MFAKGDQIEELFKSFERTTAIASKWVACQVQECVNCKCFVRINIL
jgi:hypothetical protein